MKNLDIKYTTSRDYKKLLELLMEGNTIIGFIGISVNGKVSFEYSKLTEMKFNSEYRYFYVGCTIFESDLDKIGFECFCAENNIQYIPII